MSELKPCPFCGGEAKIFTFYKGGLCVKCMNCYNQTHVWIDECIADAQKKSAFEKAVAAWNRRVERQEE